MFARAPSVARTGGPDRATRMMNQALADAESLSVIRRGDTLGGAAGRPTVPDRGDAAHGQAATVPSGEPTAQSRA